MKDPTEKKSAYLHMRVSPKLRDAMQAEARARFIDTSALVSMILGEWLRANARAPQRLVTDDPQADVSPTE